MSWKKPQSSTEACCCCSCRWCQTTSLNCSHQQSYSLSPTPVFLKLSAIADYFIRSAHTRTTFVKFPTPRSFCKSIGETLNRWSRLPQPHFFYTPIWSISKIITVGQEVTESTNSPTFCWRSTNKGSFSTDMHGCIVLSLGVWHNS
jgi:hypothetical protein